MYSPLIMALLFAAFPIWLYIKTVVFTKQLEKAPTVLATVINCEKKDMGKHDPDAFRVTYEFVSSNGETLTYEEWSEKRVQIGKTTKRLLISDKKHGYILAHPNDLSLNKGKGKNFLLVFAGVIIVIGVIAFGVEQSPEFKELLIKFGVPTGAICVTGISFFSFAGMIRKRKLMYDKNTRVIDGILLGYNKRLNHDDHKQRYSYFPIYKCVINGNEIEYHSQYRASKMLEKGSNVQLYYNVETKEIVEKKAIKDDLMIGLITFGFAIALWFTSYLIWFVE